MQMQTKEEEILEELGMIESHLQELESEREEIELEIHRLSMNQMELLKELRELKGFSE